jgi:DNA-binding transcriptional LysR family regulator
VDRLSALRLFIRVVDTGNITGAGRSLGMSSTAASKRLQDLESDLRVRLLDRTTRSVSATEAGRHLYERVSVLLDDLDGALRQAGDLQSRPAGVLRVTARRSFGMLHVLPALPAFRETYPEVEIDLTLTEIVEIAPTRGVDLVIRLGEPVEKSLVAHRLASAERVMCASPAYFAKFPPPVGPDDLDRHACLGYRRDFEPSVWVFETASSRREVTVAGPLRSNSGEALRAALLDGIGLALLPRWMVAGDLRAGTLVRCLGDIACYPEGYREEIYAVHARNPMVPAKTLAFVTHLQAFLAESDVL